MNALFIELPAFARYRRDFLDDELFCELQIELLRHPHAGVLIQGTGGLRKMRFVDERRNKGKRGGLRVIYYWWSGGGSSGSSPCSTRSRWRTCYRSSDNSSNNCWNVKSRPEDMTKRDIFSELVEGIDALTQERQGKITLRSHKVKLDKLPPITAAEVMNIRQQLNLSRSVFAMYLRTNTRTLENWEQGRATPNAQATTLMRLVQRYPDTVERLASLA